MTAIEEDVDETSARNVIFAAPADDPRARRPADVAKLVGSVLVAFVLAWTHSSNSDFDARLLDFFSGGLPGWISGTSTIVFVLGTVYTLGLIVGIGLFGQGRGAIARDMLLASALGLVSIVGLAYLAGPEFPDLVPEVLERDGFPSYPVGRLTMAVAALAVVGPYLSMPMRKVGRRVLFAMSIAALIMSYGTLSGVIGGLAVGSAAAAAVHLIFGSGLGIPSRARIVSALEETGLDVADIEYVDRQPIGATLVRAHLSDGDDVLVKVYGRDAADAAFASRWWRSIWYRDNNRSLTATSEHLAEHEALLLLACERVGAPAPTLVGGSRSSTDDILVVTSWLDGPRLDELERDEVDDATLDRIWQAFADLHSAGIAHREIDRERVVVTDDRVVFEDLSGARLMADASTMSADRAQLLVATALAAGNERAIAAARRNLGDVAQVDVLPMLQTAALPRGLQHDAKAAGLKVGDLRNEVAETLDAEAPELVQLERVSWGNVAMLVLTLFAAYSLISALMDIGFDTIAEEMADAVWAWVVVAFILAQLTNVGEYFSLAGVMGRPIPFGPTIMFRYALSFISLAVPSEAGAIGMNIRYQQKLGVPSAAAVAQGPLLTIFSKGFDVILLIISARFIGQAVDLDEIDLGPIVQIIAIVVIVAVIATVVVFAVPKLRARMLPQLKEGFGAAKGSLTDPERLLKIAAGTLGQKILFAMTLSASVAAFGSTLGFGEAIFVNSAVSLLIAFIPVPGGIGVGEAALTAGLTLVGVPEEAAVAAAITHRMVTAYLPPVFGWWSSRWLTERDYL